MKQKDTKGCDRAVHFIETRNKRILVIAEDYTELIADLTESKGQVRVCDLARAMGISHVSVLKAIKRLEREGLVLKSSQCIELTAQGKTMALFSKRRHRILLDFLLSLGVPQRIAETDVEGIEHHISETTLEALEQAIQNQKAKPSLAP